MNLSHRSYLAILALVGLSMHGTAYAATLVLSLDGDVGVTTSGSNVTGWADQSGVGNNAVPANAPGYTAPTLATGVTTAPGNNPFSAIRFSGNVSPLTTQALRVPFVAAVTQPVTIFLVGQMIGSNNTSAAAGSDGDYFYDGAPPNPFVNSATRLALTTANDASGTLSMLGNQVGSFSETSALFGGWHIYQAVYNGGSSQFYEDNVLMTLGSPGSNTNGITTDGLTLGARFASNSPLNGYIANFRVYSGPVLTAAERNAVYAELFNTYFVPEPSGLALIGFAIMGLIPMARRRR